MRWRRLRPRELGGGGAEAREGGRGAAAQVSAPARTMHPGAAVQRPRGGGKFDLFADGGRRRSFRAQPEGCSPFRRQLMLLLRQRLQPLERGGGGAEAREAGRRSSPRRPGRSIRARQPGPGGGRPRKRGNGGAEVRRGEGGGGGTVLRAGPGAAPGRCSATAYGGREGGLVCRRRPTVALPPSPLPSPCRQAPSAALPAPPADPVQGPAAARCRSAGRPPAPAAADVRTVLWAVADAVRALAAGARGG
jgi:hypothetical protein